jgi:hypothetical protein
MDHDRLAASIADRLATVGGMVAVALGGSRARGDAGPGSDIDLGLYYRPERPFSVEALDAVAREMDDRHPVETVTPIGEWGPWINGGGWLIVDGVRVDLLYRDLVGVERCIEQCRAGRIVHEYQPGHPHGFGNATYMGETHICRPLYDPDGVLARLKVLTDPYPEAMKRAMLQKYLWEASFSLETARKPAGRGDVFYVTGCLFRAAACLVQALFALNERYCINEKGAVAVAEQLPLRPASFRRVVSEVMAAPGHSREGLMASVEQLGALVEQVRALANFNVAGAMPPAMGDESAG